jgi:uncharacterized protein (TIGR03382 family)
MAPGSNMIVWLTRAAWACTGAPSERGLVGIPAEGEGVWVESYAPLALEVDGVEVEVEVDELRDPGLFGATFQLLQPVVAAVAGQTLRVTLASDSETSLGSAVVGPVDTVELPVLSVAVDSQVATETGCDSSGPSRLVTVGWTEARGVVVGQDADRGEPAFVVFADGPGEAQWRRAGRSPAVCVTGELWRADGEIDVLDEVCQGGCACANGGTPHLGFGVVAALGVLVRRRAQRPDRIVV